MITLLGKKRIARLLLGTLACVGAAVTSPLIALADDGRPSCDGPQHGRPPKPPKEAYEACVDEALDDACSVSFRGRSIDGTCQEDLDGVLFCMPDGPPPRS